MTSGKVQSLRIRTVCTEDLRRDGNGVRSPRDGCLVNQLVWRRFTTRFGAGLPPASATCGCDIFWSSLAASNASPAKTQVRAVTSFANVESPEQSHSEPIA